MSWLEKSGMMSYYDERLLWCDEEWGLTLLRAGDFTDICIYHRRAPVSPMIEDQIRWVLLNGSRYGLSTREIPYNILEKARSFYKMRRIL